ncbi:beta-amylase 2 [Tanacetum coccineum]
MSSNVTLSVELTNFEHTDLSINSESTEVDAPPVNDDNANANEGNAEDDDVAHVLDDDDDVVVSDDDEVNPSTNVEEMACVFPRSHGGDAGGSPPRQPNRPVPAQCESSNQRIETGNASLRRAFRQNGQRPLTIGFDYDDLGTFHPTGDYSSMLNSLMGETVRHLPLACEWEEIPEAHKAHIFPTLESYFDLASWYNNQDKVVMGNNVYTVGDRVKLGLQLKLRILWRKNKQRIKADHFRRYGSAEEARNHLPPKKVWGDRNQDEWNKLVDWWSHPERVARSAQNAANRAKNTILTHQGKKSFAQGRNEYESPERKDRLHVIPVLSMPLLYFVAEVAPEERDFSGTSHVPVYVMLPLGIINTECELVDSDDLKNKLRMLKSINVDGVMVDTWWGIVKANDPQQYNWKGYRKLFEIVRELDLNVQVFVMSFNECGGGKVGDDVHIPLPKWIMELGKENPDIYFTDREGRHNPESLIDKERVLRGRTAVEVYFEYIRSFRVEK